MAYEQPTFTADGPATSLWELAIDRINAAGHAAGHAAEHAGGDGSGGDDEYSHLDRGASCDSGLGPPFGSSVAVYSVLSRENGSDLRRENDALRRRVAELERAAAADHGAANPLLAPPGHVQLPPGSPVYAVCAEVPRVVYSSTDGADAVATGPTAAETVNYAVPAPKPLPRSGCRRTASKRGSSRLVRFGSAQPRRADRQRMENYEVGPLPFIPADHAPAASRTDGGPDAESRKAQRISRWVSSFKNRPKSLATAAPADKRQSVLGAVGRAVRRPPTGGLFSSCMPSRKPAGEALIYE